MSAAPPKGENLMLARFDLDAPIDYRASTVQHTALQAMYSTMRTIAVGVLVCQ
jgi:hypothetical protein